MNCSFYLRFSEYLGGWTPNSPCHPADTSSLPWRSGNTYFTSCFYLVFSLFVFWTVWFLSVECKFYSSLYPLQFLTQGLSSGQALRYRLQNESGNDWIYGLQSRQRVGLTRQVLKSERLRIYNSCSIYWLPDLQTCIESE